MAFSIFVDEDPKCQNNSFLLSQFFLNKFTKIIHLFISYTHTYIDLNKTKYLTNKEIN